MVSYTHIITDRWNNIYLKYSGLTPVCYTSICILLKGYYFLYLMLPIAPAPKPNSQNADNHVVNVNGIVRPKRILIDHIVNIGLKHKINTIKTIRPKT